MSDLSEADEARDLVDSVARVLSKEDENLGVAAAVGAHYYWHLAALVLVVVRDWVAEQGVRSTRDLAERIDHGLGTPDGSGLDLTFDHHLPALVAEVARLRAVVDRLERDAPTVAEAGIGLYREYVEKHGHDGDRARALAIEEVAEATRAVDEISRYQAEYAAELGRVNGRPRIVCLCGSTRFGQAFRDANLRETLEGRIVLSIGCDMRSDSQLWPDPAQREQVKQRLDALHKDKIRLSDEVLILNVGGYVGSSTRAEIEFAEQIGKPVRYLEPAGGAREERS